MTRSDQQLESYHMPNMAGPEDNTTTCNQHQTSSPSDASHMCLQDNEDLLLDKTQNVPLVEDTLKPHANNPSTSNMSDSTSETDVHSEENFKIDLRHGKTMKGNSNPTDADKNETSQLMCQNCNSISDDFDVRNHPHLFFIEDDDNDTDDNDNDEEIDEDNAFLDDYVYNERDAENRCVRFLPVYNERDGTDNKYERFVSEDSTKDDNMPGDGKNPEDLTQRNFHVEDSSRPGHVHFEESSRPSSPWVLIPASLGRADISPLKTVCRHSHCQMVVRCQMNHSCSDVSLATTCPPAFSPRWAQVLPAVRAAVHFRGGGKALGRQRCSTMTSLPKRDPLPSPQQAQQGQGQPKTPEDDPTHPGFMARSRSYSESDVQRLLMREMSMELRRIGDEFNHARGRRLTTVSESAIEMDYDFDM